MKTRASILWGVLISALVTAPLMALLYLGEQAADLPFVPFEVFDWLARTLPGDVIVRSIDALVRLIRALELGETSSTAKTLESLAALALVAGVVSAAGALLFVLLERRAMRDENRPALVPGALAGIAVAVPLIAISLSVTRVSTPDEVSAAWLLSAFAGWGAAIAWLGARLGTLAPTTQAATVTAGAPVMAQRLSRRAFLIRVGGATATLTVVGAGIARTLELLDQRAYRALIEERREAVLPPGLPNAGDPVEPAPGTRPEYTPLEDHYRIDINVRPPELDAANWRLQIDGLVDRPLALTLEELKTGFPAHDQYVTLACISNPVGGDLISTTRWTGAPLQDVLARAGVQPGATHLKIISADGFYETVALDLVNSDRRILLCYHWDGIPLLHQHGFPLRIYIPDLYGMKQPKWITAIEAVDEDEDGYWVVRGWDKVARMKATAVVDVAASDRSFERDGQTLIPIGGIAHAGARGISKVEVRVDQGPWVEAQLRAPLSETTWVIWRYDWPFEAGRHTFAVRCTERDGRAQIAAEQGTYPSGATGIHTLTRSL